MSENPEDNIPPENKVLFQLTLAESALRAIAAVEWPVNVGGTSPQKMASDALLTIFS